MRPSPKTRIVDSEGHFKDAIVDRLRRTANVAQFVSFDPHGSQRFSLVRGFEPNHVFDGARSAIESLLEASPEGRVNIRSYDPHSPKSHPFFANISASSEVLQKVEALGAVGLYTIVNESVDIFDGGVSGVAHGSIVEFAPGDTPRCVEKPGTLAIDRTLAFRLFDLVYGFVPDLEYEDTLRVEFSIHPVRRGYMNTHTIVWEIEPAPMPEAVSYPQWPNLFTRLTGDKAFGCLMAHLAGFLVPATIVIPRRLPPFRFGSSTGTRETWIRTCPTERTPGKYTTHHGWVDPFNVMKNEDPAGDLIASVLAQEAVAGLYSGALQTLESGEPDIQGVRGKGDRYMQGAVAPEDLPEGVLSAVRGVFEEALSVFGPIEIEWVFDGSEVWIVQLHRQKTLASVSTIWPGEPRFFHRFEVTSGLESLRDLIRVAKDNSEGILLVGNVGRTSHMCDLLRQAQIPSQLVPP